MLQKSPRGRPLRRVVRHERTPALVSAAPTLSPANAAISRPSKVSVIGRSVWSATGGLELVAHEPIGSEGRQIQVGAGADERLGEELGGAHRQTDTGTLVPARMPQAGSAPILADDGEVIRAV